MKILETTLRHREFDNSWMLMGKVPDYDNSYRHKNEDGKMVTLTPTMWIILDVNKDKNKLRRRKRKPTNE